MESRQEQDSTSLAKCPSCTQLLSSCACRASSLAQTDPWIGKRIHDQYEIDSLIARGGMGAVYKAKHLLLGTNRAIKIIRPDIELSESIYQRFKHEAQAVSGLSHPNIIAFYDYGMADQTPYVVMDLLEGKSLDLEIRAQGKLKVGEALDIFVQASDALQHAHSKGIFHRDIKPSNIMLCKSDQGEMLVKILDFGIAKIQNSDEHHKLTSTGEIFGSPSFMSPEQCRGEGVDGRSDIYSLGCVMYETLTGKPPFSGKNAMEILMKHLNEKPAKLEQEKDSFDPVLKDLEAVVMRCLEKEPAARYAGMSKLEEDLKRLSYGERLLVLQQEMGNRRRFQLISKIYKFALIAFALLLVPAAFVIVNFDKSWNRQLQTALEDPDHSYDMLQQFIADLAKDDNYLRNRAFLTWNQAQIIRTQSGAKKEALQLAIKKYQEAISLAEKFKKSKPTSVTGVTQRLIADCYEGIARSYLDLGTGPAKQEADQYLQKCLQLRKSSYDTSKDDADSIALAHSLLLQASKMETGNPELDKNYEEIEKLLRSSAPESWLLADCLVSRAKNLVSLSDRKRAIPMLEEALEYRQSIYETGNPKLAEVKALLDSARAKVHTTVDSKQSNIPE